MELIYKDECYRIIGVCFEVYKDKGSGFHEPVYDECLEIEMGLQQIPFIAKGQLSLNYKGHVLRHHYIHDFIGFGRVILEIKAVSVLADEHRSQVLNYLAASGYELGLLVNFRHYPKLEWERIANTKKIAR